MEFTRYNDYGERVFTGFFSNGIQRFRTGCCALGQFSLTNDDSVEEIKRAIDYIKEESNQPIDITCRNGGERAIFVITISEKEDVLEKKLEEIGFEQIYEFHRRSCYPEDSMLKLWIISW